MESPAKIKLVATIFANDGRNANPKVLKIETTDLQVLLKQMGKKLRIKNTQRIFKSVKRN